MKKIFFLICIILAFMLAGIFNYKALSTHDTGVFIFNDSNITIRALITVNDNMTKEEFDKYGKEIYPNEKTFVYDRPGQIHLGREFKTVHIHDVNYIHILKKDNVRKHSSLRFFKDANKYVLQEVSR